MAAIILVAGASSFCSMVSSAGLFYTCTDGTFDTDEYDSNLCLSFLSTKCDKIETQEKCDKKEKCQWDLFAPDPNCVSINDTLTFAPPSEYAYDFIVNAKTPHEETNDDFGIHITDVRMDGTRVTSAQLEIFVEPGHAKCNSKVTSDTIKGYECEPDVYGMIDNEPPSPEMIDLTWSGWKESNVSIGTKLFKITSPTKVSEFEIDYFRPKYVPGFIIKENGIEVIKETTSRGTNENEPTPKTIKYTISTSNVATT